MLVQWYFGTIHGPFQDLQLPPKAEICLEKLAVNALVKFTKGNVTAPLSNK